LLNRKQIEENIWNVYIHRCLSHHTYKRTMSSFVKIRMCPWWLITTTSSVCIHVCSIDMRKHVSAIRTTTREKIMNYQWERKRDQRVVTDDTRVLMRQTAILGARLLLLLALVCCARAQLLVLTLNHVLFLVGHDFCLRSLSLPPSPFFVPMCACTCLCCVKMNLVISTSKMTNCHDGLLSIWYWGREKKSCSRSLSSFFHKRLPINVTFHLYTLVLTRQTIFDDVILMTRWYFDLSPCPSYFLLCTYQYMSFCRMQISLVDAVTQWDKCHLSLFYKKHEWKKRK
jgi:hypothetical protein